MRKLFAYLAVAMLCGAMPTATYAADIERAQVIDGTSGYGVLYGVIHSVNGTSSAVRFHNGGLATATFEITIVNVSTGAQVGNVKTFTLATNESQLWFIDTLLGSQFVNATVQAGQAYAVYIKSSEPLAGYQHIMYNGNKDLFENPTVCTTPYNQATLASNNSIVLMNIPTMRLSQYPGSILLHNYAATAATVNISVVSSTTGSLKGSYEVTIQPNRSYSNSITNLQNTTNWTPTTTELWAHVIITDTTGAAPQVLASTFVNNTVLLGSIGLTTACAINAPVSTSLSASTSTTFDGAIAGANGQTGTFSITVPASGSITSTPETMQSVKAAVEKPQATLTATGTLRLSNGSTITLTGTYNTATRGLTVSGSGYTLTGGVSSGSTFAGRYTGPGGAAGGFAGDKRSASVASRGYCGTFSGRDNAGPISGTFNFVVSGSGNVSGSIASDDGSSARITGTASATQVSGYATGTETTTAFSGTLTTTTANGSFSSDDGTGTWTGTSCGTF